MKVLCIGVGAIGSVVSKAFYLDLTNGGGNTTELVYYLRPSKRTERKLKNIEKFGLIVDYPDKNGGRERTIIRTSSKVSFTTEIEEGLKGTDLILLATKRGANENISKVLTDYFEKHKPQKTIYILHLQNGINSSRDMKLDGYNIKSIDSIVYFNSLQKSMMDGFDLGSEPEGISTFYNATSFEQSIIIMNGSQNHDGIVDKICTIMNNNGMIGVIEMDYDMIQYGKLIVNLANAIAALTGLNVNKMLADKEVRLAWSFTITEAKEVYTKLGIETKSPTNSLVENIKIKFLDKILRLPNFIFGLIVSTKYANGGKPSMLQDFENGNTTEIDYLNGEIVKLGQQAGLECQYNKIIVSLIKEYEGQKKSPMLSGKELCTKLNIYKD